MFIHSAWVSAFGNNIFPDNRLNVKTLTHRPEHIWDKCIRDVLPTKKPSSAQSLHFTTLGAEECNVVEAYSFDLLQPIDWMSSVPRIGETV